MADMESPDSADGAKQDNIGDFKVSLGQLARLLGLLGVLGGGSYLLNWHSPNPDPGLVSQLGTKIEDLTKQIQAMQIKQAEQEYHMDDVDRRIIELNKRDDDLREGRVK